MKEGTKEDLAKHRIEKAKERLKISKELLDVEHYSATCGCYQPHKRENYRG